MTEVPLRHNQLGRQSEAWRPPRFKPVKTRIDRLGAAARRLVDLQAGSIWNDLSRVLPSSQGRVLDVGCGAQPYRSLIHPGAVYQAIDYAGAEQHFGYRAPDTTYYEGTRWPVGDASVDLILCTETLEHVPEPLTFLAEAYRCVKPGGQILITVPFAARWHFIPHDFWRLTPSGLERLLSAAGFTRITVHARGNALTVACYKVMALIVPLFLPQRRTFAVRSLLQAAGLLLLPLFAVLALIANVSLTREGGDDCLGYTALASRPTKVASDRGQRGDLECAP
jgi:SAM-dependent methyltransferase